MTQEHRKKRGWRLLAMTLSGLLLMPALVFLGASPATAATQTVTVGDFTLIFDDADTSAGATIVGYSGAGGALILPTTYTDDGTTYTVVEIGDGVFENAGITSLALPSNLKSIGSHAFRGNSISSVTFPAGIETISSNAFAENNLTSVTLPNGFDFTAASYQAFMDNDITSVTLPDSITILPLGIFRQNQISTLVVPDAVTEIGDNAFLNNQISDLTLGPAVESIGNSAFWGNGMASVVLPDSLHTIGNSAFILNDLTEVTIPASVQTIGNAAFDLNPLDTVHFLGDAPSFTGDGPWIPGADITYLCAYDEAHGGGFRSPTWNDGFENHNASASSVTATFENEHGTDSTQVVACGDLIAAPADPTADGFDFVGWTIDGDNFSFDTFTPSGAVTINAEWEPVSTGGPGDGDDDTGGSGDDDSSDDPDASDDDEVADDEGSASDDESDELTATAGGFTNTFAALAVGLLALGVMLVFFARQPNRRIE